MQIVVNGETRDLDDGASIADLLRSLDFDPRTVAVERNGEIAPRDRHDETSLQTGDRLEIVRFVQGG